MRDHVGSSIFLSLIIPAYNEQVRIADTLTTVEGYLRSLDKPCEVILVDDGSVDGTLHAAEEHVADQSSITRIVTYPDNRGKGYAVRQGVLASRGDYVAFSDADLSASVDQLPRLFHAIEKGYEVAIGSRAVAGAKLPVRQPAYRELGGKALNLIIQALAVPGIKDTQCGFKLFTGDVARDVFAKSFINGWAFDVEVLYLARRLGCTVAEIPVTWSNAQDTKVRPLRAGLEVIRDVIRILLHNYRD